MQLDVVMIAIMMALDNSLMRSCLLLLLFTLFSCGEKEKAHIEKAKKYCDSLKITIEGIPPQISLGLSLDQEINTKVEDFHFSFNNNTDDTIAVTRSIRIPNNYNYVIRYRSYVWEKGENEKRYHDYFIYRACSSLRFRFANWDLYWLPTNKDCLILDSIFNPYRNSYYTTQSKRVKQSLIEKIYSKTKYKSTIYARINELAFISTLSYLNPNDKRIDVYVKKIQNPIWCRELYDLMLIYVTQRKEDIYKLNLISKKNNKDLNYLFNNAILRHLIKFKDKKYVNYDKNLEWFQSTPYYKKQEGKYDNLFMNEDKILRNILSDLELYEVKTNTKTKLKDVIKEKKKQYYLLDFWATWCKPCVDNINILQHKKIPKQVDIIYISIDKLSNRNILEKKSATLKLNNSYFLSTAKKNQNILKIIDLQSIPRYILIDRDMNLLNQVFYQPKEPQFLKELNDIERFYKMKKTFRERQTQASSVSKSLE